MFWLRIADTTVNYPPDKLQSQGAGPRLSTMWQNFRHAPAAQGTAVSSSTEQLTGGS